MRALLASPTVDAAVKRRLLRLGADRGVDWSGTLAASGDEPAGWRDEPLPPVSVTVNVSVDVPVDGLSGAAAPPPPAARGFAKKKGFGAAPPKQQRAPKKAAPPSQRDDEMPVALRAALAAYTDGTCAGDEFAARCVWAAASLLGVVADRDLDSELGRLTASAPAGAAFDPVALVASAASAAVAAAAIDTEAIAAEQDAARVAAEARERADAETAQARERAEIEAAQAALAAAAAARDARRADRERAAAAAALEIDAARRTAEAAANRAAAKAEVERLLAGADGDAARLEREQVVAGAVQAAEAAVDAAETGADAAAAEAAVEALEAETAAESAEAAAAPLRGSAPNPAAAAATAAALERAKARRELARAVADDALRRAEELAARRKVESAAEAAAAAAATTPSSSSTSEPPLVAQRPRPPRVPVVASVDDSGSESEGGTTPLSSRDRRRGARAPIKSPSPRSAAGYLAPALKPAEAAGYKAAGVLIYTFGPAGELAILLGRTIIGDSGPNSARARRRSWNLLGGKRCARDATAEATATREMTEETGGLLTQATLRGPLSPVLWYPAGSYAVFPHCLPPGDEAWSLPERFDARRRVGRASMSAGRDTANLAWVPLASLTAGRKRLHIFMAEMLASTRLLDWLLAREAEHKLEPTPPGRRHSVAAETAFQDGRLLYDDDDVIERPNEGVGGYGLAWPPPTPPPARHPPPPAPPPETWPAPTVVTTWADSSRRWGVGGRRGGGRRVGPYADDRGVTIATPGRTPWTPSDGRRPRRRDDDGDKKETGPARAHPSDRSPRPAPPRADGRRPRPAVVVDTGDAVWAVSSGWEDDAAWGGRSTTPRRPRADRGGGERIDRRSGRERAPVAAARVQAAAAARDAAPRAPTDDGLARPAVKGAPPTPPPPAAAPKPDAPPRAPPPTAAALGLAAGAAFLPQRTKEDG